MASSGFFCVFCSRLEIDAPPLALPKLKAFWSASVIPFEPGADAEEHEAEPEHDGEEHERPLRVVAQALEEQLLLPLGRALLAGPPLRTARLRASSIRARAALAMLRTSRHSVSSAFR